MHKILALVTDVKAFARMRTENGQTMAEYGILLGFICIVVIAAAVVLGTDISSLFAPVINAFL